MGVRPRFQRAFLTWLEEARPRLALRPCLVRRTDTRLCLGFEGIDPAIECRLHRWPRDPTSFVATVHLEDEASSSGMGSLASGEMFRGDRLWWSAVDINAVAGGYAETLTPAPGEVHASREAMWRYRLFDPLLRWVNGELAQAEAVSVGSNLWVTDRIMPDDTAENIEVWIDAARLVRAGEPLDNPEWQHHRLVPLRSGGHQGARRRDPRRNAPRR
jgi:hypothetical protein